MAALSIRPTNKSDIDALEFETLGCTFRGVTVLKDDEVMGIAGILYTSPMQCVSEFKEDLRQHPKWILKTAKYLPALLDGCKSTVYASADGSIEASGRFLEHLGFVYHSLNDRNMKVYVWPGHR